MKRVLSVFVTLVVIWIVTLGANRLVTRPPERVFFDDTAYSLEDYVGWYERDDGTRLLVSWDAVRGLRAVDDPAERIWRSRRFAPQADGSFIREPRAGDVAATIDFHRDGADQVTGYTRTDADGTIQAAARLVDPPYEVEQVVFQNGEVELYGTIYRPPPRSSGIGVVMIHGSGTSDRNNLWYVAQADYLARRGITVLLPDKRGSGRSRGDWRTSSLDDFAGDALAALSVLAGGDGEVLSSIGMVGLSSGGRVAPRAAVLDERVAFTVNVVGSLTTINESLIQELSNDMGRQHLPDWMLRPFAELNGILVRDRNPVYWRLNGDLRPTDDWRALDGPGLIILGEEDEYDNVPVIRTVALLEELNRDRAQPIDIRVFEGMGHGLFDPDDGWISEDYLSFLASWIEENGRSTSSHR